MKVRITFDITDTQRVAISASKGDGFIPADRASLEAFLTDTVTTKLNRIEDAYTEAVDDLLSRLVGQ